MEVGIPSVLNERDALLVFKINLKGKAWMGRGEEPAASDNAEYETYVLKHPSSQVQRLSRAI